MNSCNSNLCCEKPASPLGVAVLSRALASSLPKIVIDEESESAKVASEQTLSDSNLSEGGVSYETPLTDFQPKADSECNSSFMTSEGNDVDISTEAPRVGDPSLEIGQSLEDVYDSSSDSLSSIKNMQGCHFDIGCPNDSSPCASLSSSNPDLCESDIMNEQSSNRSLDDSNPSAMDLYDVGDEELTTPLSSVERQLYSMFPPLEGTRSYAKYGDLSHDDEVNSSSHARIVKNLHLDPDLQELNLSFTSDGNGLPGSSRNYSFGSFRKWLKLTLKYPRRRLVELKLFTFGLLERFLFKLERHMPFSKAKVNRIKQSCMSCLIRFEQWSIKKIASFAMIMLSGIVSFEKYIPGPILDYLKLLVLRLLVTARVATTDTGASGLNQSIDAAMISRTTKFFRDLDDIAEEAVSEDSGEGFVSEGDKLSGEEIIPLIDQSSSSEDDEANDSYDTCDEHPEIVDQPRSLFWEGTQKLCNLTIKLCGIVLLSLSVISIAGDLISQDDSLVAENEVSPTKTNQTRHPRMRPGTFTNWRGQGDSNDGFVSEGDSELNQGCHSDCAPCGSLSSTKNATQGYHCNGVPCSSHQTLSEKQRIHAITNWRGEVISQNEFVSEGDTDEKVDKLTTVFDNQLSIMQVPSLITGPAINYRDRSSASIAAQDMSLAYATDSYMYRGDVLWKNTDVVGKKLMSYSIPNDILLLGDQDNIQNMPFSRYLFWHGEVKLMLQINANPFMQGLLCAFWYPLSIVAPDVHDVPNTHCVWMQPNRNTTVEISIPFVYPRNALNTIEDESLGTFYLYVFSPLKCAEATCECSVSLYSSFPKSSFSLPRPKDIPASSDSASFFSEGDEVFFVSEGNTSSVTNNIDKVMGSMTTEISASGPDTDVSVPVSLDNPMLASGAIPVFGQFSGMSKAVGVEPTVSFQLDPGAISQQNNFFFDEEELTIRYLMKKRCFLKEISWTNAQAADTELMKLNLNSVLGVCTDKALCPSTLAILNQAIFWRADIIFDFQVVRTDFASGRLRAVCGYGARKLTPATQNIYLNQVFDYSGSNDTYRMVVPYNAQTEFLRTYEGSAAMDAQSNYSMGWLGLYVANKLRTTKSVANEVKILVFFSFDNVKLAVPKPFPICNSTAKGNTKITFGLESEVVVPPKSSGDGPPDEGQRKRRSLDSDDEFESQGDFYDPEDTEWLSCFGEEVDFVSEGDAILVKDQGGDDPTNVQEVAVTKTDTKVMTDQLVSGNKFEHCISNVLEMNRRYHYHRQVDGENDFWFSDKSKSIGKIFYYNIEVPFFPFSAFYLGWSGTIKCRLFAGTENNDFYVTFYPSSDDYTPKSSSSPTLTKFLSYGVTGVMTTKSGESKTVSPTLKWKTSAGDWPVLGHGPVEKLYSVPAGGFIDIAIPFQSHFNFLPTCTLTGGAGVSCGTLAVRCSAGDYTMYQSVGDDFRYLGYRPPESLRYRLPIDTRTSKIVKASVCGYYLKS